VTKLEKRFWVSKPEEYLMFEKNADGSPAKLDVKKLRKLLDSCLNNAYQLLESARLLFSKRLYSVSILLSVLAIEELGKRRILGRYVWSEDDDKERNKIWRSFRDHKDKIYWALRPFLYMGVDTELNIETDYISLWFKEHQQLELDAKVINQIKQLSSYTNVIDGEILNPSRFARKKAASSLLQTSKQLWKYQSNVESTEKIIRYYKYFRKKRKRGESLAEFFGRSYLTK